MPSEIAKVSSASIFEVSKLLLKVIVFETPATLTAVCPEVTEADGESVISSL